MKTRLKDRGHTHPCHLLLLYPRYSETLTVSPVGMLYSQELKHLGLGLMPRKMINAIRMLSKYILFSVSD